MSSCTDCFFLFRIVLIEAMSPRRYAVSRDDVRRRTLIFSFLSQVSHVCARVINTHVNRLNYVYRNRICAIPSVNVTIEATRCSVAVRSRIISVRSSSIGAVQPRSVSRRTSNATSNANAVPRRPTTMTTTTTTMISVSTLVHWT